MIKRFLTLLLFKLFNRSTVPQELLTPIDLNKSSVSDKVSIALSDSLIHQKLQSLIFDLMWDLKKFDSFSDYGRKKDRIVSICMQQKKDLHFVNMQILSLTKFVSKNASASLKKLVFDIFPDFSYKDTTFTDIREKMSITSRMSLHDHERFSLDVADEAILILKLNRDLSLALNLIVNDESDLKNSLFLNALTSRKSLDSVF